MSKASLVVLLNASLGFAKEGNEPPLKRGETWLQWASQYFYILFPSKTPVMVTQNIITPAPWKLRICWDNGEKTVRKAFFTDHIILICRKFLMIHFFLSSNDMMLFVIQRKFSGLWKWSLSASGGSKKCDQKPFLIQSLKLW